MASYNLNEVLKKKKKGETNANGEVKLDDVSRVKVLSCSLCVLFSWTSFISLRTEADIL